jgi:hypothetical protein
MALDGKRGGEGFLRKVGLLFEPAAEPSGASRLLRSQGLLERCFGDGSLLDQDAADLDPWPVLEGRSRVQRLLSCNGSAQQFLRALSQPGWPGPAFP